MNLLSFESIDTEYGCKDKPPSLTEVKTNKYQFYQFTNSHPLYNTHHIKVGPDDELFTLPHVFLEESWRIPQDSYHSWRNPGGILQE